MSDKWYLYRSSRMKVMYILLFKQVVSSSHLAADLNLSRYWERRLSCPGRSIRVQVLHWIQVGEGTTINYCKPHSCERMIKDGGPTLSFLALYGALLSVMEVCVRLYFPDRSCRDTKRQSHLREPLSHAPSQQRGGVVLAPASTHPAEEKRFPGVAQSDQQHSAADSFAAEKVL